MQSKIPSSQHLKEAKHTDGGKILRQPAGGETKGTISSVFWLEQFLPTGVAKWAEIYAKW